jgi:hypothetical protein
MNINSEILKYANGEDFSNSFEFLLGDTKYEAVSREDAIVRLIRGCDVLHIGCSDHVPLIREKIRNNKWLHKLVTENSKSCIGIDNDRESIDFLVNELGYQNVRYGDITSDPFPEISSGQWDYALFGEMIEHLGDPVSFLSSFRKKYGNNVKGFLISVPNIYNRFNMKSMFRYREIINSDHRFWFTPYTIIKVLASAGFKPETMEFANLVELSVPELILRKIRKYLHLVPAYPFYFYKTIIVKGTID